MAPPPNSCQPCNTHHIRTRAEHKCVKYAPRRRCQGHSSNRPLHVHKIGVHSGAEGNATVKDEARALSRPPRLHPSQSDDVRPARLASALSLDEAVELAERPSRFYGVNGSPRGLCSLVVVCRASL